ncbi:MAG: hypothetical protein ACK4ZJ_19335, partial [Allorhizobium sp.]
MRLTGCAPAQVVAVTLDAFVQEMRLQHPPELDAAFNDEDAASDVTEAGSAGRCSRSSSSSSSSSGGEWDPGSSGYDSDHAHAPRARLHYIAPAAPPADAGAAAASDSAALPDQPQVTARRARHRRHHRRPRPPP